MTYKNRRKKLISILDKNSIAIITTNSIKNKSQDIYYQYRPNSDFFYLTGIKEASCIAIISHKSYILFVPKKDKIKALWEGDSINNIDALKKYGADKSFIIDNFDSKLASLITGFDNIYYDLGDNLDIDKIVIKNVKNLQNNSSRTGVKAPYSYHSLKKLIGEMRLIKDNFEIKEIKNAIKISIKAHKKAMIKAKAGMYEYQIEAIFDNIFKKHNMGHAYPPIIAAGKNGLILHYTDNNSKLKNSDLLLIDAAAESCYYAADITRTFPISGKFSYEQKKIYELVLLTQKKAIDCIKPGVSIAKPAKIAIKTLTKGLIDLKIIKGSLDENINNKSYQKFYMHNIGHFLGLDVHDVGEYKKNNKYRKIKLGMVMTIEPGLYIRPDESIAKKWWNIAIRIEDNILVTKNGHEILSKDMVKEVKDIETLIQTKMSD